MHLSAYEFGKLFFATYWQPGFMRVLDIGSLNVNGTLRNCIPAGAEYVGIDIQPGPGVDIVLSDPYSYPFPDKHFHAIVSTSCFEHDGMFWLAFLEANRVLSESGFLYINVPSNGPYHPYPSDNWRFYPDAPLALQEWARRMGQSCYLIESFIGPRMADVWNDCVMVFGKSDPLARKGQFISDAMPNCSMRRRIVQSRSEDQVLVPSSSAMPAPLHAAE